MVKYPIVFIDRDGTVNRESGYINHISNFKIYPFAFQSVRLLNRNGFIVVVITNQAGIARGIFDEQFLEKLHNKMLLDFEKNGAKIDAIHYCPHHISSKNSLYAVECDCRKPKTGLIQKALENLPVNNEKMFIIGDKYADIQTGINANCKTIMVKTGYGRGEIENDYHKWSVKPDYIEENLLTAVLRILKIKEV